MYESARPRMSTAAHLRITDLALGAGYMASDKSH